MMAKPERSEARRAVRVQFVMHRKALGATYVDIGRVGGFGRNAARADHFLGMRSEARRKELEETEACEHLRDLALLSGKPGITKWLRLAAAGEFPPPKLGFRQLITRSAIARQDRRRPIIDDPWATLIMTSQQLSGAN